MRRDHARGADEPGARRKPIVRLKLAADAAPSIKAGDASLVATAARHTKVIGPLEARVSDNVTDENDTGAGARNLDTGSRAGLLV